MHPDMIWGNDEKYSKEFQIKHREEQLKKHKAIMKEYEQMKLEEEQQIIVVQRAREAIWAHGEIIDPFIKQYLEGRITIARWILAIAMGVTLLFKGFWAMWIMFIFLYNWEVKHLKKEALEADKKRRDFGKKK